MIGYIEGKIIEKGEKSLVLLTGGIGYKVFVTLETLLALEEGSETHFWTHHAVREDASELFGFKEKEDRRFFEMLIGISGIGPKTALGVLNIESASSIKRAVASGDATHLIKVSGIGKKIAEKIVVELKDKLQKEENLGGGLRDEVEAIEALKALGYNHKDAREALREISSSLSTSERIKEALRKLGK